MTSHPHEEQAQPEATITRALWMRRLIVALTILAYIAIGMVGIYVLSLISGAVIILLISALLAFIIYPFVHFLQRYLPRLLAITIAYLIILVIVVGVLSTVVASIVQQVTQLVQYVQFLLSPQGEQTIQPGIDFLSRLGIGQEQITQFRGQIIAQLQSMLSAFFPLLLAVLGNLVTLIVIITISVYFLIDGPRIVHWLCTKTPARQRENITFLVRTLDHSLSGYFHGMLLLAAIGAMSTGIVLTLMGVPYGVLLGVLFFLLFFIPMIGGYIISALCIVAAIPNGWVAVVIVAVFMILLQQIVLGQILSPRIYNHSIGLHPIVALFALFAVGELFGTLGGFLAVPIAGVLQEIVVALWQRWREHHPEQFPAEVVKTEQEPSQPARQSDKQ